VGITQIKTMFLMKLGADKIQEMLAAIQFSVVYLLAKGKLPVLNQVPFHEYIQCLIMHHTKKTHEGVLYAI